MNKKQVQRFDAEVRKYLQGKTEEGIISPF